MLQTENLEFPQDETEQRVQFILDIIPGPGKGLLNFQNEAHISNSESLEMDYLLMKKADQYIENALLSQIKEKFSSDTINSETSEQIIGDGDFSWFIDPVDGTRNFIHGVPMFTISIGIAFRGDPIAGVIHVPAFNETYHAIHGSGAYKNETPIQVSTVDTVQRTLVSNGLPYYKKELMSEILGNISAFITNGIGMRRTGSGTLDICWIAEGRFDAMWERDMDPWDLCAASVILIEAGGKITGFQGEGLDLSMKDIVASNGEVHEQILRILKEASRVQGIN